MNMDVDQSRRDITARRINRFLSFGGFGIQFRDFSVTDEKIALPLQLLRRIEKRAIFDEQ
jgi:hypothetical protein